AVHLAVPGWIDDGDGPGDLTDAVGGGLVPGGQRRVDLPLPAVGVGVGGDAVPAGVIGGLLAGVPRRQGYLGQLRRLARGERVLARDGGLAERVRVARGLADRPSEVADRGVEQRRALGHVAIRPSAA